VAIRPVPSVMISGCTRAIPAPKPLTSPTIAPTAMATSIAGAAPISGVIVAATKAAQVATIPADRSMPPVSIVSTWQAASMARGMANLIVLPAQKGEMMPGRITSSTPIRIREDRSAG
jgi:hypothetical protein